MHQKQKPEEEEEDDPSKLLRRLSSPIYNTAPFGTGDEDGDKDRSDNDNRARDRALSLDEAKEEAAEKVQRWWRAARRTARRTGVVMSARASFETIEKLLTEVNSH